MAYVPPLLLVERPLLDEVPKPEISTDDPCVDPLDGVPISSDDGRGVRLLVLPAPKPVFPLVPERFPIPPLALLGPVEAGSRLGEPVLRLVPPGGTSPVDPLEGASGWCIEVDEFKPPGEFKLPGAAHPRRSARRNQRGV